jgi:site-specific recombinase XerD
LPRLPCPKFQKNTTVNYQVLLSRFNEQLSERDLQSITPEEILTFLTRLNGDTMQTTKRLRYALLNAFFNLIKIR